MTEVIYIYIYVCVCLCVFRGNSVFSSKFNHDIFIKNNLAKTSGRAAENETIDEKSEAWNRIWIFQPTEQNEMVFILELFVT